MDFNPVPKNPYKKKFACERCKKVLASKFSMQRHAEDCGVFRQRVICNKCQKSLKNAECLQKHLVICMGKAKKLACALCDELFCSQFSLKRHMWRFHKEFAEESNPQKQTITLKIVEGIEDKDDAVEKKTKILNFTQIKPRRDTPEQYKYKYCMLEDDIHYDYEYMENDRNIDEQYSNEYS